MKGLSPSAKWFAIPVACLLIAGMASAQEALPTPRIPKAPDAPAAKKPRQQLDDILELRKEIDEAMKANNPMKMYELAMKLQGLIQVERRKFEFQVAQFPDRLEQPKSDLRMQYDKQLKEFADSIEKLKDDKDAREAIEKARDEYKKVMEAELKKADEAQPARRPQPIFPQNPRFEVVPLPDFDVFNFRLPDAQPRFGVQLEKPSAVLAEQLDLKADIGLVIVAVLREMPAEKAGFKKNDILLQWAGKDLPADVEQFQAMIAAAKGGEKIDAVVLRKGKKETIKGIELPAKPRAGD